MTGVSHKRSIVVWDVPSANRCGAAFRVRIGVKCASGCSPEGWLLEVRDHAGAKVAGATVGTGACPGTEGLYGARLELTAPAEEGLYRFEAVLPAAGTAGGDAAAPAHEAVSAAFNVRTVPEADCVLTVVAIDRVKQAPVPDARVVVHPYRAFTDEEGVASLRLPRGRYRLFVTGRDFFPLRLDGELAADTTLRAELELDLGPSEAELWA